MVRRLGGGGRPRTRGSGSEGEITSILRSWSLSARVGSEEPAPALVFNPRVRRLGALGRGYQETANLSLRRVGAAIAEVEVRGDAGEISASPITLYEESRRAAWYARGAVIGVREEGDDVEAN